MDSEQGIQLDDLKHILRRRSRLVLALAVAGALVATFIAAILRNRYESRATLLIEPQTISTKLVEPNLSETELNTRLHLISMQILSRSRLSKVIDEFKVYPDLESKLTREEIIDRMRADSLGGAAPLGSRGPRGRPQRRRRDQHLPARLPDPQA